MGCYDTVYVPCPECKNPVGFQSKAGPCMLTDYNLATRNPNTIPLEVIASLQGESETCMECGQVIAFPHAVITLIPARLPKMETGWSQADPGPGSVLGDDDDLERGVSFPG